MKAPPGRLRTRRVRHASRWAWNEHLALLDPLLARMTPLGARPLRTLVAAVQNGVVLTPLMALTVHTLPHKAYAFDSIAPHSSLGVGRGFVVLAGVFAVMLALMVLGGHLRASWRRKRAEGRR